MTELIYPDLSYKIVGVLFGVHNQLGGGHKEKYYCQAIKILLDKEKIKYQEQLKAPLIFEDKIIGNYFLDFLIDDTIILETKAGERFRKQDIDQVYAYLKSTNLKLGILANFTKGGIRFKRILNIN